MVDIINPSDLPTILGEQFKGISYDQGLEIMINDAKQRLPQEVLKELTNTNFISQNNELRKHYNDSKGFSTERHLRHYMAIPMLTSWWLKQMFGENFFKDIALIKKTMYGNPLLEKCMLVPQDKL